MRGRTISVSKAQTIRTSQKVLKLKVFFLLSNSSVISSDIVLDEPTTFSCLNLSKVKKSPGSYKVLGTYPSICRISLRFGLFQGLLYKQLIVERDRNVKLPGYFCGA